MRGGPPFGYSWLTQIAYGYVLLKLQHLNAVPLFYSPPLTAASVRWLPFLSVRSPQQPALDEAPVRKIKTQ